MRACPPPCHLPGALPRCALLSTGLHSGYISSITVAELHSRERRSTALMPEHGHDGRDLGTAPLRSGSMSERKCAAALGFALLAKAHCGSPRATYYTHAGWARVCARARKQKGQSSCACIITRASYCKILHLAVTTRTVKGLSAPECLRKSSFVTSCGAGKQFDLWH